MANKVFLCGRLTKDVETRYTQGSNLAISNYTLAVDRRYKLAGQPEADFIRCVAMGKNGEFAEKYLRKGMKIIVTGRIQTGSYEKDGQRHYTTDVIVEEHEFAESKASSDNKPAESSTDGFMDIPDDISEELPFN